MTGRSGRPGLKSVPKPWAALLHLALFAAVFLLFLGRTVPAVRVPQILSHAPAFYTHVSNFAISYLLYAGVGYAWLMAGVSLRMVAWAGLVLVACNLVYELFVPVINTPDPVDAWYGVAGSVLGFGVLWLIRRRGLVPAPAADHGR